MKSNIVVVLDVGSTKVTCLAADLDDRGSVRVLSAHSVESGGLKGGVPVDLPETSRAIAVAIDGVSNDLEESVETVIVSVGGAHVEGLNAQGLKPIVPRDRPITYQDVLEVINHSRSVILPPDREQFQALPKEFRVDGQRDVHKPIGMRGGKLEVVTYIATASVGHLQSLDKAVTNAGVKVDQMVLAPLAAGIGVLTPDEMELGAVAVDIGAGTTDVAVFSNGSLAHAATLPVGSMHVTSDLVKLLKTSQEHAEALKVDSGCALGRLVRDDESVEVIQLGQFQARPLQRKVLAEIIEARMREIAVMVRQQIEKSGLYAMLPGGVILTGGGAHLAGVDKLFEEVLSHLRVRVAEPWLPESVGVRAGMAVPVGLAYFALQCYDELGPATGTQDWRDRVKSLFSIISGR